MKETISFSEINAWSTCRKKWEFLYVRNLVPKKARRVPMFGSCGHKGLEALHKGLNYTEAIDKWVKDQITAEEWFEEEVADIELIGTQAKNILRRYEPIFKRSNWKILEAEKRFEIPVAGLTTKLIGYIDLIIEDETGKQWVVEDKFPSTSFKSEEDVELDAQLGIYHYVALRKGFDVVGLIYEQLIQKIPAIPTLNKDGSVSRKEIYTDWETYEGVIKDQGLDSKDYLDVKDKLAKKEFFKRFHIYRSKHEVRLFMRDVERRIWSIIKKKKHIYRSEGFLACPTCPYKELCLAELRGHDTDYLIEENFELKKNRKEVVTNGTGNGKNEN